MVRSAVPDIKCVVTYWPLHQRHHFLSPHQLGACLAASVTAMIAIYLKMLLFTFFLVETIQKRDRWETQSKREEFKLIKSWRSPTWRAITLLHHSIKIKTTSDRYIISNRSQDGEHSRKCKDPPQRPNLHWACCNWVIWNQRKMWRWHNYSPQAGCD